jgi:hypothetical protein
VKLKSRLILLTTVWDILLTWVITRSLDYFVRRVVKRFRLKPIHLPPIDLLMDREITFLYLAYIASFKESEKSVFLRIPFFHTMVKSILRSHRRLHRDGILKTESYRGCNIIFRNKSFLKGFEADKKLYPPFDFAGEKT